MDIATAVDQGLVGGFVGGQSHDRPYFYNQQQASCFRIAAAHSGASACSLMLQKTWADKPWPKNSFAFTPEIIEDFAAELMPFNCNMPIQEFKRTVFMPLDRETARNQGFWTVNTNPKDIATAVPPEVQEMLGPAKNEDEKDPLHYVLTLQNLYDYKKKKNDGFDKSFMGNDLDDYLRIMKVNHQKRRLIRQQRPQEWTLRDRVLASQMGDNPEPGRSSRIANPRPRSRSPAQAMAGAVRAAASWGKAQAHRTVSGALSKGARDRKHSRGPET